MKKPVAATVSSGLTMVSMVLVLISQSGTHPGEFTGLMKACVLALIAGASLLAIAWIQWWRGFAQHKPNRNGSAANE